MCRAVQGIGAGGISQLVQITISDIVSLQECVILSLLCIAFSHLKSRGKYSGSLSVMWGSAR